MEQTRCFVCHHVIPGGIDGLANHFSCFHRISLSRQLSGTGFVCGRGNCSKSFKYFYNLRQHFKRCHTTPDDASNEESNSHEDNSVMVLDLDVTNDESADLMEISSNDDNAEVENDENVGVDLENINAIHNNDHFDSRSSVVHLINKFHTNPTMTGSIVKSLLEENESFLEKYHNALVNKIVARLEVGQVIDQNLISNLKEKVQFFSPFHGFKYYDQQVEAMVDYCGYIKPIKIPLGDRMDSALNKKTCAYEPKQIVETLQYIPVIEVLKMILSNQKVRKAIDDEAPSSDGMLRSFLDGKYFKVHVFFQKYKNALRIKLYYDELEIVNPLGSKTSIHKLGVFYYQINNLPVVMNSKLDSIHILAVFTHDDVQYGFDKIQDIFLEDLAKLESDNGVAISFENEDYILRASIENFCGDGLAVHEDFNFLGPSANLFCRLCMFSRADLHAGRLEIRESRTEQLFTQHIDILKKANFSDASKTATGLKGNCCLNQSKYFKIWNNKIFDCMHDFLCGISPMVIKLVLHEFVCNQGKFDIQFLNSAISSFNYGYLEHKNKPSPNFTDNLLKRKEHSLSQKAMQIWCLSRALPFLLHGVIEENDPHMELILCLLRVKEIVFAPTISPSLLPYLDALIKEFINNFIEIFPHVNLINKLHHITHYPECIAWVGPLVHYWCTRFEGKHNELKVRAQNMHNFKNPPETVVKVSQSVQCSKWSRGNVEVENFEILSGNVEFVGLTLSKEHLCNRGFTDVNQVFCANSLKINGTEYRKNFFVILENNVSNDDHQILFGRIEEIIVLDNAVFFLTTVCTSYFDTSLNAYCLQINEVEKQFKFVESAHLFFYKPFCHWTKPKCSTLYISLRHIIL